MQLRFDRQISEIKQARGDLSGISHSIGATALALYTFGIIIMSSSSADLSFNLKAPKVDPTSSDSRYHQKCSLAFLASAEAVL